MSALVFSPTLPRPSLDLTSVLVGVQTRIWRVTAALTSHRAGRLVLMALAVMVAVVAINLATAAPALAECAPPGVPNAAGSGMPGFFDAATTTPSHMNYYSDYGFAGMRWNNCELGGPISGNEWAGDPVAGLDTWLGNLFLGIATVLAAISTTIHKWIGTSSEVLAPMDTMIVQLSQLTRTVIVDNWMGVVLLAAALIVLAAFLTQNRRKALSTLSMAFVAIAFVAIMDSVPLTIAHGVDGTAASVQEQSDSAALKIAGVTASGDEALGALYLDTLIWPQWAEGETGLKNAKADPQKAKNNSDLASVEDKLFIKSATTYADAGKSADDQRKAYSKLVSEVKKNEPGKYQAVKGQAYNRTSSGFLALVKVAPVAAFRIPAEAGIFLTQLLMRFLPIIGPVFGMLLIFPSTRQMVFNAARSVLSAIIHTVILAFFASIHVAAIAWMFANLAPPVAVVGSFAVTIIFFKVAKPLGVFTSLIPGAAKFSDNRRERRQERKEDRRERREARTGRSSGHEGQGRKGFGVPNPLGMGRGSKRSGGNSHNMVAVLPIPAGVLRTGRHPDAPGPNNQHNSNSTNTTNNRPGSVAPGIGTIGLIPRIETAETRTGGPQDHHTPGTVRTNAQGPTRTAPPSAPPTAATRRQGTERAYVGGLSDEQAKQRGFFVPPSNNGPTAPANNGANSSGRERDVNVRIFVPPTVTATSDEPHQTIGKS